MLNRSYYQNQQKPANLPQKKYYTFYKPVQAHDLPVIIIE